MKRSDDTIKISVAGGSHHKDAFDKLKKGNLIYLLKEPKNPYDHDAIQLIDEEGRLVGYVANSSHTIGKDASSATAIKNLVTDDMPAIVVWKSDVTYKATAIIGFDNEYLLKFLHPIPTDEDLTTWLMDIDMRDI